MASADLTHQKLCFIKYLVITDQHFGPVASSAKRIDNNEPPFGTDTAKGSEHHRARNSTYKSYQNSYRTYLSGSLLGKWTPLERKDSNPLTWLQETVGIRPLTEDEFIRQSRRPTSTQAETTMSKRNTRGRSKTPVPTE